MLPHGHMHHFNSHVPGKPAQPVDFLNFPCPLIHSWLIQTRTWNHDSVTCNNVWRQTVPQPSTSNGEGSVSNHCILQLADIQLMDVLKQYNLIRWCCTGKG